MFKLDFLLITKFFAKFIASNNNMKIIDYIKYCSDAFPKHFFKYKIQLSKIM